MALFFKEGVRLRMLQPQALLGMVVASQVFEESGLDCTVTSGEDSKHRRGSLHYSGAAFDLRTRDILPERAQEVASLLRERLDPLGDFDVVLEDNHLHIEVQPHEE